MFINLYDYPAWQQKLITGVKTKEDKTYRDYIVQAGKEYAFYLKHIGRDHINPTWEGLATWRNEHAEQ